MIQMRVLWFQAIILITVMSNPIGVNIDVIDPNRISDQTDDVLEPGIFLDNEISHVLGGDLTICEASGTTINGEPINPREGIYGRAGTYVEVNDFNFDGDLDLYVVAQIDNLITKEFEYKYYILYGSGSRLPSSVNLEDADASGFIEKDLVDSMIRSQKGSTGDIDNDGYPDRIVGSYSSSGLKGEKGAGRIDIAFNYTSNESIKKTIFGIDPDDNLGRSLALVDVNLDGLDDIIVGAPGGDGPMNDEQVVGELHVFFGRPMEKFPSTMVAKIDSDVIIYGNNQKSKTNPPQSGDMLGERMMTADINGDGEREIALLFPYNSYTNDLGQFVYQGGEIQVYDSFDLLGRKGTRHLQYPSDFLSIRTDDQEDRMGYGYTAGDIDGDGITDLIISSPTADGTDNSRGNSGEVNIIYGSPVSIDDVTLSGEGAVGSNILCGGGKFNLNVTYVDGSPEVYPEEMVLHFTNTDTDVKAVVQPTGIMIISDSGASINVYNDSLKAGISDDGKWLSFDASADWSFPMNGPADIIIELIGKSRYVRSFYDRFNICKDVLLSDDMRVTIGGHPYEERGGWAGIGEELEISSLNAYYKDVPGKFLRKGSVDLIMLRNGEEVDRSLFDTNSRLVHLIQSENDAIYSFSVDFKISHYEDKQSCTPVLEAPIPVQIEADDTLPGNVNDLTTTRGEWPDDDFVTIGWTHDLGKNADNNGSGIKNYAVRYQDGTSTIPMESDGLWGTYFIDERFHGEVFGQTDHLMDFDWGDWGPDPEHILPSRYSIRWHGWFHQQYRNPAHILAEGSGELSIYLDGECLVEWKNLEQGIDSPEVDLGEGGFGELIILYRCTDGEGSLRLFYEDPLGSLVPLGEDAVYYPSNATSLTIDKEMILNVSVISVDWVGLRSGQNTGGFYYDLTPPIIDLSEIPNWLSRTTVYLDAGFIDPVYHGEKGSGLGPDSISYRIKSDREPYGEWRRDNMSLDNWSCNDIEGIRATVRASLDDDFSGIIQFRAEDLSGNVIVSDECPIAVDLEPPRIIIQKPDPNDVYWNGSMEISLIVFEDSGSGPDPENVRFRYRSENGPCSGWMFLNTSLNGTRVEAKGILECGYGNHSIQFLAMDLAGNTNRTEEIDISIIESVKNLPPIPKIRYPLDGSVFHTSDEIVLDASGTNDDGWGLYDEPVLTWYSNISGYLGSGGIINIYLEEGEHRIILFVDDGSEGHNMSTYVDISVIGIPEDDDLPQDAEPESSEDRGEAFPLEVLVIILIILFLGFIAFMLFSMHRKGSGEVRLDIKDVKEEDDDPDE